MYEFSGLFEWLKSLIWANGIQEEVGMTKEEKLLSWIDYFLDIIQDYVFGFLENCSGAFNAIGNKFISLIQIDFTSNFLVVIVGFIFGFWLFKFVLGKVIDLASNLIDIT